MVYHIHIPEESEWDVAVVVPDEFVLPDADYQVPQTDEDEDDA